MIIRSVRGLAATLQPPLPRLRPPDSSCYGYDCYQYYHYVSSLLLLLLCIHKYIYIYIYRERERDNNTINITHKQRNHIHDTCVVLLVLVLVLLRVPLLAMFSNSNSYSYSNCNSNSSNNVDDNRHAKHNIKYYIRVTEPLLQPSSRRSTTQYDNTTNIKQTTESTVSSHDVNLHKFKSRISNPRANAYVHFNTPFEHSNLPGARPICPD